MRSKRICPPGIWLAVSTLVLPLTTACSLHASAGEAAGSFAASEPAGGGAPRPDLQRADSAFAGPSAGRSPVRFANGASATGVPFEVHGNHINVRGVLNGKDSVWVVLDTGASSSVLDEGAAGRAGLELEGGNQALGAGGAAEGHEVRDVTIGLPGLEIVERRLDTLPLADISRQSGRPMDVIVGHPLFSRCVVAVDYESGRLDFWDAPSFDYQGTGAIVPITFEENHPYIEACATLPGQQPICGRFVVDTGAASGLIFSPPYVQEHGMLDAVKPTIELGGRGVGGMVMMRLGRIESFAIGPYRMERPLALFRGEGAGRVSAPGTLGNVGGEILRRFRVIFDYSRGRMILEPRLSLKDPFEADMSGLTLALSGADTVRVARVLPGSPAEGLGIRPGDVLEAVDGRPVASIGLSEVRRWFRQEGRTLRLTLQRDGERLQPALTTRRMI